MDVGDDGVHLPPGKHHGQGPGVRYLPRGQRVVLPDAHLPQGPRELQVRGSVQAKIFIVKINMMMVPMAQSYAPPYLGEVAALGDVEDPGVCGGEGGGQGGEGGVARAVGQQDEGGDQLLPLPGHAPVRYGQAWGGGGEEMEERGGEDEGTGRFYFPWNWIYVDYDAVTLP